MKAPAGSASLVRLALSHEWWVRTLTAGCYTLALNTEDRWGNEIRVRLYYSKGARAPRVRAMRDDPIRGTKTLCHPVTGLPVATVADVRSAIQTGYEHELSGQKHR